MAGQAGERGRPARVMKNPEVLTAFPSKLAMRRAAA